MMKNIRETKVYKTSDSQVFENIYNAEYHQRFLNFKVIMNHVDLYYVDSEWADLYLKMADFFGVDVNTDFEPLDKG